MSGEKEKLCFVLMSFREELKVVYTDAIQPACENAGFSALRADELIGPYNINRDIIEYIFRSDVVITDLTDWNPNVFYEMGVAHAIDNKTIMIIQKGQNVPFDIHNYRCIPYQLTESGLKELTQHLITYLKYFQEWRKRPTNPVQEFKPYEVFVLQSAWEALNLELQQKEGQLKAAVPKIEWEVLKKQLETKIAEHKHLEDETMRLLSRSLAVSSPRKSMPATMPPFRTQPLGNLSIEAVLKLIRERDFFHNRLNKGGKGIQHQYLVSTREGEKVIIDYSTGLTWQQGGTLGFLSYTDASKYIRDLNSQRFAGYNEWRLPTLEEVMSLLEPETRKFKQGVVLNLFIDSLFDNEQVWLLTADNFSSSWAWVVDLEAGDCFQADIYCDSAFHVRGVCSEK